MGKKSRRPNRKKPKDIPAVASTAAAAAPQEEETANDAALDPNQECEQVIGATFHQLIDSQDWEGALEHESEISAMAKKFERSNPGRAGRINFMLGCAHKWLGREGGIEEATLYC